MQLTKGFVQLRLDIETIIGSAYPSFGFGGRNSVGQQFLTSAFSYKFSFSSGRTVGQFPNCTKPRTLCAMQTSRENMTRPKLLDKSALLFVLLISLTVHTFGQDNKITEVKFNFWHSRRIPNHHVTVELQRFKDTVNVHVASIPSSKSSNWDSTKRDYSFKITTSDFDNIIALVRLINGSDIVSNSDFSGYDGTTCDIEFGGYAATIKYRVWTPDFETKERKLQQFLDACKLILQTARLNPDEILE